MTDIMSIDVHATFAAVYGPLNVNLSIFLNI